MVEITQYALKGQKLLGAFGLSARFNRIVRRFLFPIFEFQFQFFVFGLETAVFLVLLPGFF